MVFMVELWPRWVYFKLLFLIWIVEMLEVIERG